MSNEFDDMPDGGGKRATEEDYSRIWRYMASRNRKPSVRTVLLELAAQNYVPPAVATSARWAKKLGLSTDHSASPTQEAETRQRQRRDDVKPASLGELGEVAEKSPKMIETGLLGRMHELLKAENSSTQLAITENRTRMAFNVALMEFYAETPTLLADAKAAAAFIDAVTIASKLSGGASIDIILPKPGEQMADDTSPGGHPMKTIGGDPLKMVEQGLVANFKEFQAKLRNGQGA